MRRFFLLLLLVSSGSFIQAQNYREYFAMAEEAYQVGNYSLYQQHLIEANRLRPNHQTIMYQLAIAHALNDLLDSSCFYLEKVIAIDAINYDLSKAELNKLNALPCFQQLEKRQVFLQQAYNAADTVQVINDAATHIEGVAFDKVKGMFLVSSINNRNIYWVDREGGLAAVLDEALPIAPTGLSTDSGGNLWVASMGIPQGGLQEDDPFYNRALLFKIDLANRTIIQQWEVTDGKPHLFGDVFINSNDEVYVSDTRQNEVFQLKDDVLKPLLQSDKFISLQGITIFGNYLILADYVNGLFAFNLSTKKLLPIHNPFNISLKGIDGLYGHENQLIAIQNGVKPNRVTAITLNESFDSISDLELLEKNHPAFGEPTLGYVLNHKLFFIANSFWGDNNNGVVQNDNRELPVILKLDLLESYPTTDLVLVEQIKVLDNHLSEALYFYENNWAAFRSYAKAHGYLADYSLRVEPENNNIIWLETVFTDSIQFDAIEEHFKEWVNGSTGPRLLNELPPNSFRKSIGSHTQQVVIDSDRDSRRVTPACNGANYRAFDFWIGEWEVYDTTGVYIGHNIISKIEGGCGLQERWNARNVGFTGSSYNYYNKADGKWHQTWVDNQGGVLELSGEMQGISMVMQSQSKENDGETARINKIKWTPLNEKEVIQKWELSEDGGITWKLLFQGIYKKQ